MKRNYRILLEYRIDYDELGHMLSKTNTVEKLNQIIIDAEHIFYEQLKRKVKHELSQYGLIYQFKIVDDGFFVKLESSEELKSINLAKYPILENSINNHFEVVLNNVNSYIALKHKLDITIPIETLVIEVDCLNFKKRF